MSAHLPGTLNALGARVAVYGRLVRFSHTVFALPFALSGVVFASHELGAFPGPDVWAWVLIAMIGARSAAMAFNRIVDARFDAANPRTANREIPSGAVSRTAAWGFTTVSVLVFVLATWRLNPMAFALSPLALAIVFFYSFTKRFTWASHLFLGLSLAVAPVGGWVAVTGRLEATPFLLGLAVGAWVAGFDVFYALQDLAFDRRHRLHSLPARFGDRGALLGARLFHAVSVGALVAIYFVLELSPWYLVGLGIIVAIIVMEHRLVRPGDVSGVRRAFFDMNAWVSVIYFLTACAGVLL